MIAYIKGELAEVAADHIVVETGGIGYTITMAASSMDYLPQVGEEVKIHTYLQVREDGFTLFGFLSADDLAMFRQLITVSGIGPKGGLAILSVMSADDVRFAVLSGDAKAIARAPGVGNKTAQRVILDLKDKVSLEDAFEQKLANEKGKPSQPETSNVKNDAIMALNALGYTSSESMKAVSKVPITEDMDVEDVLKAALRHLALF